MRNGVTGGDQPGLQARHESGILIRVGLTMAALAPALSTSVALQQPSPPDQEAGARLLAIGGEGFQIRKTDHYTLAYDTPYEALRPLIGRLEGTYDAIWRFCEASDLEVRPPGSRLEVLLFARYEDFSQYLAGIGLRSGSLAGVYDPLTNVSAFCHVESSPGLAQLNGQIEQIQKRLKRLKGRGSDASACERRENLRQHLSKLRLQRDALAKRFNRLVIQHEAAHQMLYNVGVHVRGADNPLWLTEGMACQFEIPQAGSTRPMGRINHLRLADFRDALGALPDVKSVSEEAYAKAFAERHLVPIVDLITDDELFAGQERDVAFRYAQAWALVYYLHHRHREEFVTYLRRLGTRKPGEHVARQRKIEEFESAFGKIDTLFQRTWITYMLELRFDRRAAGR